MGQQFNASITLFNNSTGQEANAGVTITGSNLTLFPSCPDSTIISNDCPTAEAGVFSLSSTGSSLSGDCPPGTWAIAETTPGVFSLTPPATLGLEPGHSCTVNFTAVANTQPTFDSNLNSPGVQTNQIASIDAFSPVTTLTVRNSGSSQTSVIAPPPPAAGAVSGAQAGIKVTEGCKRIATVKVTGQDIRSVTFYVDGRRVTTVTSKPYQLQIKAYKLSAGRHNVSAKVNFNVGSDQPSTSLKGGFLTCQRAAKRPKPNFTG
jgi:hypothetical protein